MSDGERRGSPRRDLNIRVTLEQPSKLQEYFSRNLSEGGILLQTDEPLPIGSEVDLRFVIPELSRELKVTAKVVRHQEFEVMDDECNPSSVQGVGLAFTNLTSEEEELLQEYVTGKNIALES